MRILCLVVVLLIPSISAAQLPSCDDQLAVSNQLLQDINQNHGRAQVENASLKVQLGRVQKELQESKSKASASPAPETKAEKTK